MAVRGLGVVSFHRKLHAIRKANSFRLFLFLALIVIFLSCYIQPAQAQDSPGRFEVGGNLTGLRVGTFFNRSQAQYGPGLEGDFNFGRHFALDAALSWLPDTTVGVRNNVTQGLFGAKVGTRTQHFGFFGKVRPGFVSIRNSPKLTLIGSTPVVRFPRLTEAAIDFGGVFEYYPSKHWALRYDLGDTLVFEENHEFLLNFPLQGPRAFQTHPENRFQFSTGVHYRF